MVSDSEQSLWMRTSLSLLDAVLANDTLRGVALKIADRRLYQAMVSMHRGPEPRQCQMDGYYLLRNLFYSLDRALSQDRIAPSARRAILELLIGKTFLGIEEREAPFFQKFGFKPPGFLTISPGKRCNLHCTGCYAGSSGSDTEMLDYEVLTRIVREKTRFWGSHFTVISGGEPLLYRSCGKGILDLAEEYPDNYFMFYTNGTLIGTDTSARLAESGNLTPAISVEGLEAETDGRRGKGVYRQISKAFGHLREAGVPFGISVTVTRHNADLVFSDEFLDRYFEEEGAIYCWIFQYMPIGRSYTLDLMVTPEQRVKMYNRMMRIVTERRIFVVDFWNSGPATNGCIAAGRPRGYFHIDWNGTITPCVFFPYSTHNIVDVYREGGDLNTVLMSPLFVAIRKWQREYGYLTPTEEIQNQIVPCPIRDHHSLAVELIRTCKAAPAYVEAAEAIEDEAYHEGLTRYGEQIAKLTERIWQRLYLKRGH